MSFLQNLIGVSPKKVDSTLKHLMKKVNIANAPKGYSKNNIIYSSDVNTNKSCPSCDATLTYLFATEYKNTFEFSVYYKKTRSINGKKYGPWRYSILCFARFNGLPIKDYVKTQAKLKELYKEFNFYFNKDNVEAYVFYSDTKTIKDIENAIYKFANTYRNSKLVDSMNAIHDEYYKKG